MSNLRRKLLSELSSLRKLHTVSGTNILSFYAKSPKLKSLTQQGKCVQNGTPTPSVPAPIVCNNGELKQKHQSGLPLGYTLLDYIESTGGQYIDTNISGGTKLIIDVVGTPRTVDSVVYLFGEINDTGYTRGFTQYLENWIVGGVVTNRNTFEISYSSSGLVVNGTTTTARAIKNDENLGLFGSAAVNRRISGAKVYFAKIYNGTNIIRDFVPCKNASNVIGMYDRVSGQFFTNRGTGNFIEGPAVSDPIAVVGDGTQETIIVNQQVLTNLPDLLSVGDYKDGFDVVSGLVTRQCEAVLYDGTQTINTPYLSTTGGLDVDAIIVHRKTTPTTEQMTPTSIPLQDGTTNITVDAEVDDVEIDAVVEATTFAETA